MHSLEPAGLHALGPISVLSDCPTPHERPVEVVEHRAGAYYCPRCGEIHHAPMPPQVERGGLIRPELTALAVYLKDVCRASFTTIRKYFRGVLKITISRGQASHPVT